MIVLRDIEVENYRNIKNAKLTSLGDLNILIGPNNCGKTNILNFISLMKNLEMTWTTSSVLCQNCRKFAEENSDIPRIYLPLASGDFYIAKSAENTKITLKIAFDEDWINSLAPGVLKKQKERFDRDNICCQYVNDGFIMESNIYGGLFEKHLSIFIHGVIIEEIKRSVLYCPEMRLQNYKDKEIMDYITDKQLRGGQKRQLIDFLKRTVDPTIDGETYGNLIRRVENQDFQTAITEQGSGVRSLICIAVDILFSDASIILIDEPELGLNPLVKQEFLKFLCEQSKTKQVFVATQDPTYINPALWKNENVAVYLYSTWHGTFVRVNPLESTEDPNTFAGYLPHAASLKDIHMYVEGSSDVYIFQIFLQRYLREKSKTNWWELFNRVGIYHLGGDFWKHLLYTVPRSPYTCIVILDGDKKKDAESICSKYETSRTLTSNFKSCQRPDEVRELLGKNRRIETRESIHPVYCLKESCIERYLKSTINCKNLPQDYNKKVDGPRIAEICGIPEEIEQLFEIVLGLI